MSENADYTIKEVPEEMPEEFNDLMFKALDHGFDSIEDNCGPLIPFVMSVSKSGENEMVRFMSERIEKGVDKAKEYISDSKDDIHIYALAFDGFLTLRDQKYDAIFVEAGMRGREKAWVLAQQYKLKGFFKKKNIRIGNPVLVQQPPSRLDK